MSPLSLPLIRVSVALPVRFDSADKSRLCLRCDLTQPSRSTCIVRLHTAIPVLGLPCLASCLLLWAMTSATGHACSCWQLAGRSSASSRTQARSGKKVQSCICSDDRKCQVGSGTAAWRQCGSTLNLAGYSMFAQITAGWSSLKRQP